MTMNRRTDLASIFMDWLPIGVALTAILGFAYVSVQQVLRTSGNDPQIQLAEDGAAMLAAGRAPADVLPDVLSVDASESLAPYAAVYDAGGHPLAWSARMDGAPPSPPAGVFNYARAQGENRVTWQPRAGVRHAIVIASYTQEDGASGFVLAGRSLREIERREAQLSALMLSVWLAASVASLGTALLFSRRSS